MARSRKIGTVQVKMFSMPKHMKKQNRVGNLSLFEAPLFFAAYGIWLTVALLNTTPLESAFGSINFFYCIVPVLLVFDEAKYVRTYGLQEWVYLAVALVLNIQTWLVGKENLAVLTMFVFSCRRIDFCEIAKITILIDAIVLVTVPLLSCFDIISNEINIRPDGTIRSSMGFSYVTYPSYVLLNLVLLFVVHAPKGRKAYWAWTLVLLVWNTMTYLITDARNGCMLIYLALLFAPIVRKYNQHELPNAIKMLLENSYLVIFFGLVVVVTLYLLQPAADISKILDSLSSLRLTYTSYALTTQGVPLWGGTSVNLAEAGLIIDSSFFRILFDHGLIVLIVVLLLLTRLMRIACAKREWIIVFALEMVALHSVFDAQLISLQHNTLILLVSYVIFGSKDDSNEVCNEYSLVGRMELRKYWRRSDR